MSEPTPTSAILFSVPQGSSIVSEIIRRLTNSEASHCAFLYYDAFFKCMMVMEADWYGFGLLPFARWSERNKVVASFYMPLDEGLRHVAQAYLGTGYDYGGAVATIFYRILKLLKHKVASPLYASKAVFCSEAAVLALQKQNYPGIEVLVPSATTPGDLLDFLRWHTR